MDDIEITLVLEENVIKCKKKTLVENSDYFRVMFEGSFKERFETNIEIKDVDFRALTIVLTSVVDDSHIIEDQDLLLVLQAAAMLQFVKIQTMCVNKLTETLSWQNCLKIWLVTEPLGLAPLYLKAKNLALLEFHYIKDLDCILDLSFIQLRYYFANVYLCPKKESDIFATCMKWWYDNSITHSFDPEFPNATTAFSAFLTFIDFHAVSESDMREMIAYPGVRINNKIIKILTDMIAIKSGNAIDHNVSPLINIVLNGRRRQKNSYPCILIDAAQSSNYKKKTAMAEASTSTTYLENPEEKPVCGRKKPCNKNVLLYDAGINNFRQLFAIQQEKLENLEGFQIIGYKELIFLFGGEFSWGRGGWSDNFWVYDTTVGRWERKTTLPHRRRHFECCIADDIVYIVGGTGHFRVLQDNMFWYNYKLKQWSNLIILPCPGRQIKCCEYKNQLFLLNIDNKCGYLFKFSTSTWITLKICDNTCMGTIFPEKFVIFSYEDCIYIKGSTIVKLKIVDNRLEVVDARYLGPINVDSMESVLCNGILYVLSKRLADESNWVVFEKFDVSTGTIETILEYDTREDTPITLSGELSRISKGTKLFSLAHFSAVETNTFLTEFFE